MMTNRLLSAAARLSQRPLRPRAHRFSTAIADAPEAPGSGDVFPKIAFLGAGKMSQAMLSPLLSKGLQSPASVTAYDVSDAALSRVSELYPGVRTASSIPEAVEDANLIVYGVKPQNVERVHSEMRRARDKGGGAGEDAIVLSIAAGVPIRNFVEGSTVTRVARSMPNTPAQVGAGVTVWSCTANVDAPDRKRIKAVLDSFGKSIFVDDESFIDMSTSISGSGPAYIFLLMEAMIDAGVHMGFGRETATTLVHHTLLGSTKFAMETGEHPAVLRNSVTSPAGTTASAIYELENGRFRTVIKDAIWACYRRSLEMGGQCSQVGPHRRAPPSPTPPSRGGGPGGGGDAAAAGGGGGAGSHHPVRAPVGEMGVPSSFGDKKL